MFELSIRRAVAMVMGFAALCASMIVLSPTISVVSADGSTFYVETPEELSAAITVANANPGPDTIIVTADLELTGAMPQIRGPLTIEGQGANRAITVDTAGFRLIHANGTQWDEPAGDPAELRLAVAVRNLTITGGNGGGGSMMRLVQVHGTIDAVTFVDNVGGWEGNIYAVEGNTYLYVHNIDVTGQSGTLLSNDHGNTPRDSLDGNGNLVLTDANFNNRVYIDQSRFNDNTGCVLYTHRFVTITNSTFTNSDWVCLTGVSTRRLSGSTFTNTWLYFANPWVNWDGGPGTAYVQLADVSVTPSIGISNGEVGGRSHLVVSNTTLCGQPIEEFEWSNPFTADWTELGGCLGSPPNWTDDELPAFEFGGTVDDGVAATGSPAPIYSVSSGALPTGLTLDTATGAITGSPTVAGAYSFEITATNASGSVAAAFAGTIVSPVSPDLVPLPALHPTNESFPITSDGVVNLVSPTGLRVQLTGATTTASAQIKITVAPLGLTDSDRGVVGAGARFTVVADNVSFDALEVCVPFDLPTTVATRPLDRVRLVWVADGVEHDITTHVTSGEQRLVCGTATAGGTFQAIVLAGDRIAGTDRYSTAAAFAIEMASPGGTDVVYIANGQGHADATIASTTAARDDAPLLFVEHTAVPDVVVAALTELAPERIVVIGGSTSVSPDVVAMLRAFAPTVDVVGGANRY